MNKSKETIPNPRVLEIALASQSPRRRELLENAGFGFRLFPVKVSEIFDENLNPAEVVSHLATVKARAAIEQNKELKSPGFLLLTADTLVFYEGKHLGKPENPDEAMRFLRLLSGKMHSVMSGFCLRETGATNFYTESVETLVEFRKLSEEEIRAYVATGEPLDKAGAYGIQGAGGKFVSSFRGSKSNVVGLPMERLESALKENGWNVRRLAPTKN
jgi:septum formation protein